MTYVPYGPLWCWALQGADAMFFSQPTETSLCLPAVWLPDGTLCADTPTRYAFPARGPCVARCQHETRFQLDAQPIDLEDWTRHATPPVQCGGVARLDPTGRWLCDYHYRQAWTCLWCDAPLPSPAQQVEGPEGWRYCSPYCATEPKEPPDA